MANSRTEDLVSKRLKFRDLRVFFAVVNSGSMAEAARQLDLTQPAVSEIISQLEHLFAARLFDRTTRGVEVHDLRPRPAGTGPRSPRRDEARRQRHRIPDGSD